MATHDTPEPGDLTQAPGPDAPHPAEPAVSEPAQDAPGAEATSLDQPAARLTERRSAVPVIGVCLALGMGLVAGLSAWAYNRAQPAPVVTITPTPAHTPFALVLPSVLSKTYSRDAADAQPTANTDGSTTVTGTYSKGGQATVVVMLGRPADDAKAFLQNAGFDAIAVDPTDGACGTSADNNANGCVVIRDHTAILTVGLLAQDASELLPLDRQFATQLSGV